jgi:hypothetical protein
MLSDNRVLLDNRIKEKLLFHTNMLMFFAPICHMNEFRIHMNEIASVCLCGGGGVQFLLFFG